MTDDVIVETTETVIGTISMNTGDADISIGTGSDTINITDNDSATLAIDDVTP